MLRLSNVCVFKYTDIGLKRKHLYEEDIIVQNGI